MNKDYALGLFFILLVALIWAAASVLVQYIYQERDFHSPFLLTYVGVSLFTLWLPFRCVTNFFRSLFLSERPDSDNYVSVPSATHDEADLDDDVDFADDLEPRELFSEDENTENTERSPWSEEDHVRAALKIAPVWFLANWTYNGSLALTSITRYVSSVVTCRLMSLSF